MWVDDGGSVANRSVGSGSRPACEAQQLSRASSSAASAPGVAGATPPVVPSIPNFDQYILQGAQDVAAPVPSSPAPTPMERQTEPRASPSSPQDAGNASQLAFEELSCPLCLELYDTPCMLQCGHGICWTCLDALRKRGSNETLQEDSQRDLSVVRSPGRSRSGSGKRGAGVTIVCPSCAAPFALPEVSSSIPVNHSVSRRISELTAPAPVENGCARSAHTPNCDKCEASTASVACEACDLLLCTECNAHHHKGAKLRSHELLDVRTYLNRTADAPYCHVQGHGRYRRDLVCTDTGESLCLLCYQTLGHDTGSETPTPSRDSVVPVQEALERGRERLASCVRRVQQVREELRRSLNGVEQFEGEIREATMEEVQRLRADFRRLRQEVDQEEFRMVSEMTKAKEAQLSELQRLSRTLKGGLLEANVKVERARKITDTTPPSVMQLHTAAAEATQLGNRLAGVMRDHQARMGADVEPESAAGTSRMALLSRPVVMTMNTASALHFIHSFAAVEYELLLDAHAFTSARKDAKSNGKKSVPKVSDSPAAATPDASPRGNYMPTSTPSSSSSSHQNRRVSAFRSSTGQPPQGETLTPSQQARRRGNSGADNVFKRSHTHAVGDSPGGSPRLLTLTPSQNGIKSDRVVHSSHKSTRTPRVVQKQSARLDADKGPRTVSPKGFARDRAVRRSRSSDWGPRDGDEQLSPRLGATYTDQFQRQQRGVRAYVRSPDPTGVNGTSLKDIPGCDSYYPTSPSGAQQGSRPHRLGAKKPASAQRTTEWRR